MRMLCMSWMWWMLWMLLLLLLLLLLLPFYFEGLLCAGHTTTPTV